MADNQAKHICKFTYKYASEDCFSVARRCRARAMHQRFFIFAPKKARARKRRYSLHAQARLRFARCALLRLCRNACRAIFAFALMSKLLDANCLIIGKEHKTEEIRRISTSKKSKMQNFRAKLPIVFGISALFRLCLNEAAPDNMVVAKSYKFVK